MVELPKTNCKMFGLIFVTTLLLHIVPTTADICSCNVAKCTRLENGNDRCRCCVYYHRGRRADDMSNQNLYEGYIPLKLRSFDSVLLRPIERPERIPSKFFHNYEVEDYYK